MNKDLIASANCLINSAPTKVWFALTDKETIKEYFYGTETNTNWQVGSKIVFSGNWNGTLYQDIGFILKNENEKLLQYSYWSSFWGEAPSPNDFSIVTYELSRENNSTHITVTQQGFKDEESKSHSVLAWESLLANLKSLLEK